VGARLCGSGALWELGLVGAGLARERPALPAGRIPERCGVGMTYLGRFAGSGGLAWDDLL
jgi:hypothetical protein